MSRNLLFLIGSLIFGLSVSCESPKEKAVVSISVYDSIPRKMFYSVPVNGASRFAFRRQVDFDSTGQAQIEFNIDRAVFIHLITMEEVGTYLIIEPGKTYDVRFNSKSGTEEVDIISDDRAGQLAYNQLDNFPYQYTRALKYLKASVDSVKTGISEEHMNDMKVFDRLYEQDSISEDFYSLVKTDREIYYQSLIAKVGYQKYLDFARFDGELYTPEVYEMWKDSFRKDLLDSTNIRSPWLYVYTQSYMYFKEFTEESGWDEEKWNELAAKDDYYKYKISLADKYLSADLKEYYLATFIHYWAFQRNYNKEFIEVLDDFKTRYPESKYTEYIQPEIDRIVDFHNQSEEFSNPKIKLVGQRENVNSIQDLISRFPGKKLYVNFWATWCGPCKDEFEHNPALYELLNNYGIEAIYVADDEDDRDEMYKNMINYYNLEGHNIRTTDMMHKDLFKQYSPKMNGIELPWFMLVNEQGKIVVRHASGPSDLDQLEQEIITSFNSL